MLVVIARVLINCFWIVRLFRRIWTVLNGFFRKLQLDHFRALLGGKLDRDYAEACRHTVHQEAAMGMDGRIRSTAGSYVLKAAMEALGRKYRFSSSKVVACSVVLSKVISFDVSNGIMKCRGMASVESERLGILSRLPGIFQLPLAPIARMVK